MDRSPFHISIFHLYRGKSLRKETIRSKLSYPFCESKTAVDRLNTINLLSLSLSFSLQTLYFSIK